MLIKPRLIGTLSGLLLFALSAQSPIVNAAPVIDASTCSAFSYKHAWEEDEESGAVTLAVLVGENGNVISSKLLKSSGYQDLDTASLRAIKRCVFKSAAHSGDTAQTWAKVRVDWVLE